MDIERVRERFGKLRQRPLIATAVCDALEKWIENSTPDERRRLVPYALAETLGHDVNAVVSVLLQGTQVGLLDLNWDIHCPHCSGLTDSHAELGHLISEGRCEGCELNFAADFSELIEVTFTLNREIEVLEKANACTVPANRPRRMSGLELIHHPEYAKLFGKRALSQRERLRITSVTIVFTDIAGSTRMYEQIGDADAYNLVRDHFEFLIEATEKHGGTVLKTIGDAVMASFLSNRAALLAIDEAMQKLNAYNKALPEDRHIRLRFGLHTGPAILVTLNERLDYFGRTVNKAARIQSVARSDELSVSQEVFTDRDFQSLKPQLAWSDFRESAEDLKGIAGRQLVYTARFTG